MKNSKFDINKYDNIKKLMVVKENSSIGEFMDASTAGLFKLLSSDPTAASRYLKATGKSPDEINTILSAYENYNFGRETGQQLGREIRGTAQGIGKALKWGYQGFTGNEEQNKPSVVPPSVPPETAAEKATKIASSAADATKNVAGGAWSGVKAIPGEISNYVTKNPGTTAGIATGLVGGAALAMYLKKKWDEKFAWQTRGCEEIQDPTKKSTCQKYVLNKQISALTSDLNKCNTANDPEECKTKLMNHIYDLKKQLSRF